ncbi:hypothetical protein EVAR_46297_1 [Eumeta japonica]|uniref:Uncharacterized protein n=1 Tax=Eumeta variegata TaxID=151549 RepID=A0A4C1XZJ8_EUMVA|nr:hypothetical protein EVAR_46297_1 [Eumeta japonica]
MSSGRRHDVRDVVHPRKTVHRALGDAGVPIIACPSLRPLDDIGEKTVITRPHASNDDHARSRHRQAAGARPRPPPPASNEHVLEACGASAGAIVKNDSDATHDSEESPVGLAAGEITAASAGPARPISAALSDARRAA